MAIWIMGHDHVKTLKPKNFAEKVYFITFFSSFTDFTVKFKVHISLYNIYKAIHPIKIILGIWRYIFFYRWCYSSHQTISSDGDRW